MTLTNTYSMVFSEKSGMQNCTYNMIFLGNQKQNENKIYRMGENICKWCDQQRLNFQNIQTAHTTQQQQKQTTQ